MSVKATNPDVILLDLGWRKTSCGWELLNILRTDTDTQGIPLLAISDTEQLLEDASRNFNVRHELLRPYDILGLEEAIAAAVAGVPILPHPAPRTRTNELSVRVAEVLARDSEAIMAEWLHRVRQEELLTSVSGNIPLRLLMNNQVARNYGVTLAQVIKEFELLRDGAWSKLESSSLAQVSAGDVFALGRTLNLALDAVTVQVATVYDTHASTAAVP